MPHIYSTQSPLERLWGDKTSALHIVIDDLNKQRLRWLSLSSDERDAFDFKLTPADAKVAQKEYYSAMCLGEQQLANAAMHVLVPRLGSSDVARLFISKGNCTAHKDPNYIITEQFDVGRDIPLEEYNDALRRSDVMLSDKYRPSCGFCSSESKRETHKTILSFTQYSPREMAQRFLTVGMSGRRIDILERCIDGLESVRVRGDPAYDAAYQMLDNLKARCSHMYDVDEEALRAYIREHNGDVLFGSSRPKGNVRVAEKILRSLISTDSSQILDMYGMRIVTKNDAAALDVIRDIRCELEMLYGREALDVYSHDALARRSDAHQVLIDDHVLRIDKPGHKSYKLWAPFGEDESSRICVAFQTQSYENSLIDVRDHPFYEERQQAFVEQMRNQGQPVRRLRLALYRVFDTTSENGY